MKLKQYFRQSLEQYFNKKLRIVFPGMFLSIPIIGGPVEFKITKKDLLESIVDVFIKKGDFYDAKGNIIKKIDLSIKKKY